MSLESEKSGRTRDWMILPALGLLTVVLLAGSAELAARWFFPVSEIGLENCFVTVNPSGFEPVKPNSVCWERVAESPETAEYRFNSRGDRAGMELTARQPGTYRIVMIGSSFSMGLFVPREKTFAALLPKELSARTGHRVELYNEARGGEFRGGPYPVRSSVKDFDQVLSAQPNMILWVVTPMDFENAILESSTTYMDAQGQPVSGPELGRLARTRKAIEGGLDVIRGKLQRHWDQTRISLVLKHLLLGHKSQMEYVTSYLENEGDAGFLRSDQSARWRGLVNNFDTAAAAFEAQAKAAGVSMVVVLLPNRAQAAMLSMREYPEGYDPFKLDEELRSIVESHGATYVDILPQYRNVANPEKQYFPVDGHPDAAGHATIANLLNKALTSEVRPSLFVAPASTTKLSQDR